MALISVIIPVYNKAPWLAECLESILLSAGDALEQLEIILVDDGSTDGSGEICRDYARRYPQIQLLEKPNGGVASARNRGLSRGRRGKSDAEKESVDPAGDPVGDQ